MKTESRRGAMKTGSLFLLFLIWVAAIVLKEGAVDAGRDLKQMNILTAQADTIPCVHHNLVNGVYEMGDVLKNKLPSGPSPGVGHNYINSVGSENMKTTNTLKMNKLPSGPSGGVGNNNINAVGKASAERLITTTPFNKLPSGPSPGVGHNYINSVGSEKMEASNAGNTLKMNKLPSGPSGGVGHKYINGGGKASSERLITTTPLNKLPSGPSGGVGHSYND